MTISATHYFGVKQPARKKEPRLLAVIDKDSCTSCNACATVCPVDCIYEVVGPAPSQSYHVIDSTRCIGCQLCYRIPSESTERYTLNLCPWNAIDMLHNPNVSDGQRVLERYYVGAEASLPWEKLDEFGFQLATNGEVRVPAADGELIATLRQLAVPQWGRDDDIRRIVDEPAGHDGFARFDVTPEGRDLLTVAFRDYPLLFLD
jgi:ferredoxin